MHSQKPVRTSHKLLAKFFIVHRSAAIDCNDGFIVCPEKLTPGVRSDGGTRNKVPTLLRYQ